MVGHHHGLRCLPPVDQHPVWTRSQHDDRIQSTRGCKQIHLRSIFFPHRHVGLRGDMQGLRRIFGLTSAHIGRNFSAYSAVLRRTYSA